MIRPVELHHSEKDYVWEQKYPFIEKSLKERGLSTAVGDGADFAPKLESELRSSRNIIKAISAAGL